MARALVGRSIRRIRQERGLTQAALAVRLGISASYLNLIEHDERPVTASLLIKLSRTLDIGIDALSGSDVERASLALREALGDPELGVETPGEEALAAIAGYPAATHAILALSRAWASARDDASGLRLPSGRRVRLPWEEARTLFNDRRNHFPALERAARSVRAALDDTQPVGGTPRLEPNHRLPQSELNHAIADRLRRVHELIVRVVPLEGVLRSYDPAARMLLLSDLLKRESRGFQMAFQLMYFESGAAVESLLAEIDPSSPEATSLLRIGLLNYAAAALLMPYDPYLQDAIRSRYDIDLLAARYAVSYEQAAQRLSTLQAASEHGVPFFFVRMDAAGNITKAFSNAGFPFAQSGSSCPLWIVNTAFELPDRIAVQIGKLSDGTAYLCIAKAVTGVATGWHEPPPRHVIALGCHIDRAPDVVYADGIDLDRAATHIGVNCRLCDWMDCRSRAFPPLHHRLSFDVNRRLASPMVSEVKARGTASGPRQDRGTPDP